MPNIKPIGLSTGHISNDEIKKRIRAEEKVKGSTIITTKPPKELSTNGKKIYKNIIAILPESFLNGGDVYIVTIVSEALARMQECQIKINEMGLFLGDGDENKAVKTYDKYSKIFEKFSSKIGLSPKDRTALAILTLNSEEERNDDVLKVLRGE